MPKLHTTWRWWRDCSRVGRRAFPYRFAQSRRATVFLVCNWKCIALNCSLLTKFVILNDIKTLYIGSDQINCLCTGDCYPHAQASTGKNMPCRLEIIETALLSTFESINSLAMTWRPYKKRRAELLQFKVKQFDWSAISLSAYQGIFVSNKDKLVTRRSVVYQEYVLYSKCLNRGPANSRYAFLLANFLSTQAMRPRIRDLLSL